MILYTGGRYQGKLEAAINRLDTSYDCVLDFSKINCKDEFDKITLLCNGNIEIFYNLESLVRLLVNNMEFLVETKANTVKDYVISLVERLNPKIVIISEVGAGVIPIDKKENEFREITGEISVELARRSQCVIRMVCGIEQIIKDDNAGHD